MATPVSSANSCRSIQILLGKPASTYNGFAFDDYVTKTISVRFYDVAPAYYSGYNLQQKIPDRDAVLF